jgi:hypothetical protein
MAGAHPAVASNCWWECLQHLVLSVSLGTYTKANFASVRFEVFTAVTMKNAVFWDVAPCVPCENRHFGGTQGFTFLYVDDVRTSLEAHAFTSCYGDSFTLSCVDDVGTSQETPMCVHVLLRE